MTTSATEPQSEDGWLSDLDSESEVPIAEIVDLGEADATEDEGSPPETEEGSSPEPQEGDAKAEQEGPDAAEGAETADAAATDEPGEAPPDAEAAAEPTPDAAKGDDPPATTEAEQDWDWEPATLQADRTELDIPGVLKAKGQGLWIPESSLPKLQSSLANRGVWERERQRRDDRIRELEASTSDAEKAAESAVRWFAEDFWKLTDDEKWAWLQDQQKNQPLIQAQMQAAREKSRGDRLEAQRTQRENEAREQAEGQYRTRAFATETARAVNLPAVKDLGIDVEAVRGRLRALESRGVPVFFRATKEFIAAHPQWGLEEGELTIDYRHLSAAVEQEAELKRATKAASAVVEKAKAVNQSKERGAQPKKAVAPAVRAGSTPAPSGKREQAEPKTETEWLDSLKT